MEGEKQHRLLPHMETSPNEGFTRTNIIPFDSDIAGVSLDPILLFLPSILVSVHFLVLSIFGHLLPRFQRGSITASAPASTPSRPFCTRRGPGHRGAASINLQSRFAMPGKPLGSRSGSDSPGASCPLTHPHSPAATTAQGMKLT